MHRGGPGDSGSFGSSGLPRSLDPSIPRIPRFLDLSISRFLDPSMQHRQKSVDKGAREGPRRDFRRF